MHPCLIAHMFSHTYGRYANTGSSRLNASRSSPVLAIMRPLPEPLWPWSGSASQPFGPWRIEMIKSCDWCFSILPSGYLIYSTLWLFNVAMENGPCIDDFPIKTTIYIHL